MLPIEHNLLMPLRTSVLYYCALAAQDLAPGATSHTSTRSAIIGENGEGEARAAEGIRRAVIEHMGSCGENERASRLEM